MGVAFTAAAVVLPAYAGMIRRGGRNEVVYFRAPRVCGDDPRAASKAWLIRPVLPAYAGMIRASTPRRRSRSRAPRVCGDDPFCSTAVRV